jgi:hypothetical protein
MPGMFHHFRGASRALEKNVKWRAAVAVQEDSTQNDGATGDQRVVLCRLSMQRTAPRQERPSDPDEVVGLIIPKPGQTAGWRQITAVRKAPGHRHSQTGDLFDLPGGWISVRENEFKIGISRSNRPKKNGGRKGRRSCAHSGLCLARATGESQTHQTHQQQRLTLRD